ncbi:MAG: TetR/AcrR family transcriptional regulator [Solirubrobacteraceae bacterium]
MVDEDSQRPQYAEGREALLTAAARVIARDGFGGLTYRSVAEAAGTTHGLVSYHFGSRDNLIHETVLKACRDAVEGARLEPESGRLEDFASGLSTLAAEASDEQVLQFELALEATRRKELVPEVRTLYEQYFAVTRNALASFGLEPHDALVRLVFAALDGITLQQLIYDRPQDTEASIAALRKLISGFRDGGQRDGGQREGGQREGGQREGGQRDGGQRDGGQRDGECSAACVAPPA